MNNNECLSKKNQLEIKGLKTSTECKQIDLIESINSESGLTELKINQKEMDWIKEGDNELEKTIEEIIDDEKNKNEIEQLDGNKNKILLGLFSFIQSVCKTRFKEEKNDGDEFPVSGQTLNEIKCHQQALETLKIIYILARKNIIVDSEIIRILRVQLGIEGKKEEEEKVKKHLSISEDEQRKIEQIKKRVDIFGPFDEDDDK